MLLNPSLLKAVAVRGRLVWQICQRHQSHMSAASGSCTDSTARINPIVTEKRLLACTQVLITLAWFWVSIVSCRIAAEEARVQQDVWNS